MEIVEVSKMIGSFSVGAICLATLITTLIYVVRVTIPNMQDRADARHDKQLDVFSKEMASERAMCREDHATMNQAIQSNQRSLSQISTTLARLVDRIDGKKEQP